MPNKDDKTDKCIDDGGLTKEFFRKESIRLNEELDIMSKDPLYSYDNMLLTQKPNEYGWYCWPDYQKAIYRNTPNLYWGKTTHSSWEGYRQVAFLPESPNWATLHVKTLTHHKRMMYKYDKLRKQGLQN